MKKVNRETIIDIPWWYETWQHSGYNHTCETNFPGIPEEPDEVPGADEETKKSFTVTIPWNLASLARNYHAIIVRQHHTVQKQMGLPKEPYVE